MDVLIETLNEFELIYLGYGVLEKIFTWVIEENNTGSTKYEYSIISVVREHHIEYSILIWTSKMLGRAFANAFLELPNIELNIRIWKFYSFFLERVTILSLPLLVWSCQYFWEERGKQVSKMYLYFYENKLG